VVKVTNPNLQKAVDQERLNLLVVKEMPRFPVCGDMQEVVVSPCPIA